MSPTTTIDELPLWIFDGVLSCHEHDAVYGYCINSLYTLKHLSDPKIDSFSNNRFVSVLTPEQIRTLPTTKLFFELTADINLPSQIKSVYINSYDKLSSCSAHVDCAKPALTMLYYANTKWDIDWGGETLFFNNAKEIAFGSVFKPNRVVLFDSRILHIAKMPTIKANASKFSIAYKGESLNDC